MTAKKKFDPYDALGVKPDADKATIRKAYRRKAKDVHPDAPGGSTEAFRDVSRAVALLTDDRKRSRYDQTGDADASDTAENADAEAWDTIAHILKGMMQDTDEIPPGADALAAMKSVIANAVADVQRQMEPHQRLVFRHERLLKRFRKKERKGRFFMEAIVGALVKDAHKAIAKGEAEISCFTRAIELLDQYEFEVERHPPPPEARTSQYPFFVFPTPTSS